MMEVFTVPQTSEIILLLIVLITSTVLLAIDVKNRK